MEMPYALSYLAHKRVYEFSAAWHVVNADYYYFLAAGFVHTLLTDKVFAWVHATALRRLSKLDLDLMASGPGGQAMLDTFHKMHKATEVFPWTIVAKDVIRRDTQTRAARQVHVRLDSLAEYGLMLSYPCRGFASLPAFGGGLDDNGDTPVAVAQGNGGLIRQVTRSAGGPSRRAASSSRRGLLSPVREILDTAACEGHWRATLEDVWTSPEAFQAAVALFGDQPSRRVDGQRVTRGVGAAALALAWNLQTEALRLEDRDAHGYVLEDAMPVIARAMSVAADSAVTCDLFSPEVERRHQVAAVPPSPVRFDAGKSLASGLAVMKRTRRTLRAICAVAVCLWTVAADGMSAPEAGWSRTSEGPTCVLVLLDTFTAVACRQKMLWWCYTPFPLMGSCHLDFFVVYTVPAHGFLSFRQREFDLCSAVGLPVKVKGDKCPCGRTITVLSRVTLYIVRCTGHFGVDVPGGTFPSGG